MEEGGVLAISTHLHSFISIYLVTCFLPFVYVTTNTTTYRFPTVVPPLSLPFPFILFLVPYHLHYFSTYTPIHLQIPLFLHYVIPAFATKQAPACRTSAAVVVTRITFLYTVLEFLVIRHTCRFYVAEPGLR